MLWAGKATLHHDNSFYLIAVTDLTSLSMSELYVSHKKLIVVINT